MKKLSMKRLLLLSIVFTMILQHTYVIIGQTVASGLPSSWAIADIEEAITEGLVIEELEGKYGDNITRKDFAKFILNIYEYLTGNIIEETIDSPFEDTDDEYIIKANMIGLVNGKGDGKFYPNDKITREEIGTILYRALRIARPRYNYTSPMDYDFEDKGNISSWAKESINFLYGIEIINGIDKYNFSPKTYTTREQAILLGNRLYKKVKEIDKNSRGDITPSRGNIERSKTKVIQDNLKIYLASEMGKPYLYGGAGPNAFDCSGLVYYVYNKLGIKLPRVSAAQATAGTYIAKDKLEYGDLVFFASNGRTVNHVGVYIGNGNFIHAPQTGDVVKVSSMRSGYYARTYYTARRVIPR